MENEKKFCTKNIHKLDNPWRREILPPKETLSALGLSEEDTVADIGCGIGYFTLPAAELVTSHNKIYALDTSAEMLEEVKKRSEIGGLSNIVPFQTNEYDLTLPDNSVSYVLIANVLHEIDDQVRFLQEVKRVLKPLGRLAIIEWEKKETEMGPEQNHRISKEEVEALLRDLGYKDFEKLTFGNCFYGIVTK